MKEELEAIVTIKIKSFQRELAVQFTMDIKETMNQQQTQQQEQTKASFEHQQVTLNTTIQQLISS
eukprot:4290669-Ditylum_brightwellii.AAC.1